MSELVTISFRRRDGHRAHIHLPWQAGKQVRQYLHSPLLRPYALVGQVVRLGLMDQNRKKLRLRSVPETGDVIFVGRRQ